MKPKEDSTEKATERNAVRYFLFHTCASYVIYFSATGCLQKPLSFQVKITIILTIFAQRRGSLLSQ